MLFSNANQWYHANDNKSYLAKKDFDERLFCQPLSLILNFIQDSELRISASLE